MDQNVLTTSTPKFARLGLGAAADATNILTSTSAPITAGRASILLKAKASTLTPTAGDYTDTITMIASATF